MSQAFCCLGLKTGSENITLKIYVKLSKRHDIWALSFSEIKWTKCDTSSPLFSLWKASKAIECLYRDQTPSRVYCEWRHLGVQNLMVCVTPFRGQFGGVWTQVGSTYVWEWTPRHITKRVTLVYLYHVNRCGHHKKLSIAKLDFVQVCRLSLNLYSNTLRKFYKFSDSRETWTSPTLQSADWPISRQYYRSQVRKRVSYPEV